MSDPSPETTMPVWEVLVRRHWAWLLVGLTVLFVLAVRVRLRELPFDRYESEYAYTAQLLLRGIPPYQEVYNANMPGGYVVYAAIMAVLGQLVAGIHLGVAAVNLVSIILVFLVGRKILDEVTGVIAAAVFGLMSLSPAVHGLAGHATHFLLLFSLAGLWLLLLHRDAQPATVRSRVLLAAAGFSFGVALLMKHQGLFFGMFGLLLLGWRFIEPRLPRDDRAVSGKVRWKMSRLARTEGPEMAARARNKPGAAPAVPAKRLPLIAQDKSKATAPSPAETPAAAPHREPPSATPEFPPPQPLDSPPSALNPQLPLKTLLLQLAIFISGLAVPFALTCVILWFAGVLPQFWFWSITEVARNAFAISLSGHAGQLFRSTLSVVAGPDLGFFVLGLLGMLVMWWDWRFKLEHRVMLLILLLCAGAAAVGIHSRGDNFIPLLPAVGWLAGAAVSRAVWLVQNDRSIELFLAAVILVLLAVGLGAPLLGYGITWLATSPSQAMAEIHRTSLFNEAAKIGEYIKAHSNQHTRVAVLGSEPEIYFYAQRRSAIGRLFAYPLMEPGPAARRMQEELIADLERTRPEFVVFVYAGDSWLPREHSDGRIFDWWKSYWPEEMILVHSLRIQSEPRDDLLSPQADPARRAPSLTGNLSVFKRKSD